VVLRGEGVMFIAGEVSWQKLCLLGLAMVFLFLFSLYWFQVRVMPHTACSACSAERWCSRIADTRCAAA
jgi:hypothetical protein